MGQSGGLSQGLSSQMTPGSASRESSFSGAVRDQGVRLHGHRRHRPTNAPGLPERAGGRRSPPTHRADHGQRAGLESGAEDSTTLTVCFIITPK